MVMVTGEGVGTHAEGCVGAAQVGESFRFISFLRVRRCVFVRLRSYSSHPLLSLRTPLPSLRIPSFSPSPPFASVCPSPPLYSHALHSLCPVPSYLLPSVRPSLPSCSSHPPVPPSTVPFPVVSSFASFHFRFHSFQFVFISFSLPPHCMGIRR